jgi:hypothetical protein
VPEELDDTTAAEVGHALIRWLTDEDPAGVARFLPELGPVDDPRAARVGHAVVALLGQLDVA